MCDGATILLVTKTIIPPPCRDRLDPQHKRHTFNVEDPPTTTGQKFLIGGDTNVAGCRLRGVVVGGFFFFFLCIDARGCTLLEEKNDDKQKAESRTGVCFGGRWSSVEFIEVSEGGVEAVVKDRLVDADLVTLQVKEEVDGRA